MEETGHGPLDGPPPWDADDPGPADAEIDAEIDDEFRDDGWWHDADVLPTGEEPDGSDRREPPPPPETLLEGLNDEQRAAVQHENGPLLILAGPGSGKTRVICHRIAWLVRRGIVRAGNILGVTFTNKAAGEMRERVDALLGDDARGLRLSTYHALCARMLRSDGHYMDVPRNFVIYDRDDSLRAARLVIKKLDLGEGMASPRSLVARISGWKNDFMSPGEMAMQAGNHREKKLAEAFEEYQKLLKEADALDFDDLLLYGVAVMASSDEVRRKYAERFRYILVDEYQDTNSAQYQLTLHLAEKHRNVCAVGDPDQAIYGWRGADVGNIDQFKRDFPEATVVRLERNYRSSSVIVNTAATLIEANRDRPDKRMWTERSKGAPIDVISTDSDHDEADRICDVVRDGKRRPARDRGAVPDERAVAHDRGRAAARRGPLPHRREHPVLRTARDQGRAGVPEDGHQPERRREPAAHHQRAAAAHRRPHDREDRGGRRRGPSTPLPCSATSTARSRTRARCGASWCTPPTTGC